ncbi:hypothetical protein CMI48_01515 [Candidatus Pacearchaeota archaeon]|jgi:hypothetical protein|nr:hypothetical protein [Candidatus Pacearchaeota archaeon]|tara:strand:+ start:230 stop:454 length:225 start_codon:yes stop_codon:yes gene_type:complete
MTIQDAMGWIGLALVMIAYLFLNTKKPNRFIPLDLLGTAFLILHAILITDLPFVIVNTFIFCMWAIKFAKGGIK